MERVAKVTSKGQVTIPSDVRRALHIREGDTVVFETYDAGAVRLRLLQPVDAFAGYEGAWREGEGHTIREINGWIREMRDNGG